MFNQLLLSDCWKTLMIIFPFKRSLEICNICLGFSIYQCIWSLLDSHWSGRSALTEERGSIRQPPSASCPTLTRCTGRPVQVHLSPCSGAPGTLHRFTWYPAQAHRSPRSRASGTLHRCTQRPVQVYMSPYPGAQVTLFRYTWHPSRYTCHLAKVHSLCSTGHPVEVHLWTCTGTQVISSRCTGNPALVHRTLQWGAPCTLHLPKHNTISFPCPGASGTCHVWTCGWRPKCTNYLECRFQATWNGMKTQSTSQRKLTADSGW